MGRVANFVTDVAVSPLSYRTRRIIKKTSYYVVLSIWLVIMGFPLYWMLVSSLRPTSELYDITSNLILTPAQFTLKNWEVFTQTAVAELVFNTLIVATGVIAISVFISTLAGYGLTRYDFPFKLTFARVILFGYMFSPIVLAIPMYIIFRQVGLLNSYLGIILAQSTTVIPFSVWLMWKLFQTVPKSVEEAGWMMGAPRWRTFLDIAIPHAFSGILAVSLFAFAIVWNDFTFARILLPTQAKMTLSPGLIVVLTQQSYINPGHIMAMGVAMSAVPIAFAYWLQRYLLQGFKL